MLRIYQVLAVQCRSSPLLSILYRHRHKCICRPHFVVLLSPFNGCTFHRLIVTGELDLSLLVRFTSRTNNHPMCDALKLIFFIAFRSLFFFLRESFSPYIARTTAEKVDTKLRAASDEHVHVGDKQNVERKPVERRMTVVGCVSLVLGLHAVANAEHPDVAEEEPNEEKHAQCALHAASEGDGADHQAVNGLLSLEHRSAEVASGREQKEDNDAQTTGT
jgi:hypothetical protein